MIPDPEWPRDRELVPVAIIRRGNGRSFAIADPPRQDTEDVEITPHCFRMIEEALQLWPKSKVDIYRDEWARLRGDVVASRRIVGPSSRKAGAGPSTGVVYRGRTARLTEEQNRLCETWMRATGAAKNTARAAYESSLEASR